MAFSEEDHQIEGTDVEWVHLLRQFSTARTLHVSWGLASHIALALEVIAEEVTVADSEGLPSLDLIYLEGQPAASVKKFVYARRLSGRPVTVVDTITECNERLGSYVSK